MTKNYYFSHIFSSFLSYICMEHFRRLRYNKTIKANPGGEQTRKTRKEKERFK